MDKHVSSLFCSNDRLLFITLIPDRNGGKCPFEDSITAERERGVSLWQAQIEWAICRTNWCLKSLQDLIGLKEEPGNGWCAYLRGAWAPREPPAVPETMQLHRIRLFLQKSAQTEQRVNRLLCFRMKSKCCENHPEPDVNRSVSNAK